MRDGRTDDEPLSRWAEHRDMRIGRLRTVPVVSGDGSRGSRITPEASRSGERSNGHVPVRGWAVRWCGLPLAPGPRSSA
ncbi:DUF6087 family protein [Streptomyces murinus]